MSIVNASEFVKTHIRWTWETSENANERAIMTEAVTALFALADGWLDVVAVEIRLGIYDSETFTEASTRPPAPFHLLRADSAVNVRVEPTYRSIESRTSVLDAASTTAWIDRHLADSSVADARYAPSLRELLVAGSRTRLPDAGTSEALRVSCYAGEIEVPIDHCWVTAPRNPPGVPDPVSLRITNFDGQLRLILEVFWSAWADDPERPAPTRRGRSRLHDRNWRVDE